MAEILSKANPTLGLMLLGGDRVELGEQIRDARAAAIAELEAAGYEVGCSRPEIVSIVVTPGSYTARRTVHGEEQEVYGDSLERLARDVALKENNSKESASV
jgi:hypothetical protein